MNKIFTLFVKKLSAAFSGIAVSNENVTVCSSAATTDPAIKNFNIDPATVGSFLFIEKTELPVINSQQPANNNKDSKLNKEISKRNEQRSNVHDPRQKESSYRARVNDDMACCTAAIKNVVMPAALFSFLQIPFIQFNNFLYKH